MNLHLWTAPDRLQHALGRASSNAALAAITVSSSCRRPTICNPTGSPSGVNPAGMEAAGCPLILNGKPSVQPTSGLTDTPSTSLGPTVLPSAMFSIELI